MKIRLLILLLFSTSCLVAQLHLPYQESWRGYPFAAAFANVETMSSTTYHSMRDLKRGLGSSYEEVHFDSFGRSVIQKVTEEENTFEQCWAYSIEGNASSVYCGKDSMISKQWQKSIWKQGKLDTLFHSAMDIRIYEYDEKGNCIKIFRHQKLGKFSGYQLLDSTTLNYDLEGRIMSATNLDSRSEVHYYSDSISISYFDHDQLVSRREILCGQFGLPIKIELWRYDPRRRKQILTAYSILTYSFRE